MRTRKPVRVIFVASLVTFTASGCTTQDVVPQFESGAKGFGYTCVETVPPVDQVEEMRSCVGEDGERLNFALFDSEESRLGWADVISAGENPTSVGHSDWAIVGESEKTVQGIASDMGAETSQ